MACAGDIFDTLGYGSPDFGPYTYNNNQLKRSVSPMKRSVRGKKHMPVRVHA